MAEAAAMAVASPILELVIEKLGSRFWQEMGLVQSVNRDMDSLQSVLSTIKNVLDDAERRSIGDKALTDWLSKLKDAAFDADDVVDEFQYEALRRRIQKRGTVRDFFSPNNRIAFRRKMARKILNINMRLGKIAEERSKFHLAEGSTSGRTLNRETFSDVIESEVYGRDQDKEKIINFLVSEDDSSDVPVLPIAGLGGVGKTTLAQFAYNDQRIKEHFDIKLWVCVSDDFSILRIISKIIECETGDKSDLSNLQAAKLQLHKILNGRRFLLVLDDVWNENEAEWERLKTLLRGGKQGSKIITTTRSDVVARIMGTVATHRLECLTSADCWTLFKQRAFGPGREEETPRLVQIGKEILEKCGRLPLAAKALGSLMGSRRGEAEWLQVRNNELWRLAENENGILPALQLSYDHLPSNLKQCFAYCSILPKDYEIHRDELIQLWIAEGLIQTLDGDMHAEEVGNQYFNRLLWRSFFQVTRKDNYNNIMTCRMHNLVHELACFVARAESLNTEGGIKRSIPHGCRYSLIVYDDTMSSTTLKADFKAKKLRSLIFYRGNSSQWNNIQEFAFHAMSSHTHLRVLDLANADIKRLPCTISKLKHLRLLDLSHTKIAALPRSITDLHNLRTLKLRGCYKLKSLPEGISNMRSLRHLDIYRCYRLICLPRWLGRLSSLQTIQMFVVGKERGRTISELEHLNLISGDLEIRELCNVQDPMEASKANLAAKTNLLSLKLCWENLHMQAAASRVAKVEEVFERLQPHSNLKKLFIECYPGIKFPTWMTRMELASSPIRNLVTIMLKGLERCECLPALGHLPFLEDLSISEMNAVRRIGVEFYGDGGIFPSLQSLTIREMRDLEEFSTEATVAGKSMMAFPFLESFSLRECPKLKVAPRVPPSVVKLSIDANRVPSAMSTEGLYKLRRLQIRDCLSVSRWEWMQDLTALAEFFIDDDKLTCLPEGILQLRMPTLESVRLTFPNLKFISGEEGDKQQQPPAIFISIQNLQLYSPSELTALPEWLGSLTSLKSLHLYDCPKLVTLPDGLQRLTMLQSLDIPFCPTELKRRCERERGEDWPKISHIPNIMIFPKEDHREEKSQRRITRSIRNLRLTSCIGRG